jgi:hypothetical protein
VVKFTVTAVKPLWAIVFGVVVIGGGVALYEAAYGSSNSSINATNSSVQSGTLSTVVQSSKTITTVSSSASVTNNNSSTGFAIPPQSDFYSFGNIPSMTSSNYEGWQMPADTLLSTTFNTTETVVPGQFSVSVNVLPYNLSASTTIYLGLYVNGQLFAQTVENLGTSHAIPAAMVGQPTVISAGNAIANFTDDSASVAAAHFLSNPLPAGSTITFTEFANAPIWIQVVHAGTLMSYETSGTASIPTTPPSLVDATPIPVPLDIEGQGNLVEA